MECTDIIREYDGLFFVDEAKVARVQAMMETSASFDAYASLIEINYTGRDTNRHFVTKLKDLASIIGDADGEVTCSYQLDGEDPRFEFYTIADGKLHLQEGRISRSPTKSVL